MVAPFPSIDGFYYHSIDSKYRFASSMLVFYFFDQFPVQSINPFGNCLLNLCPTALSSLPITNTYKLDKVILITVACASFGFVASNVFILLPFFHADHIESMFNGPFWLILTDTWLLKFNYIFSFRNLFSFFSSSSSFEDRLSIFCYDNRWPGCIVWMCADV